VAKLEDDLHTEWVTDENILAQKIQDDLVAYKKLIEAGKL
jgi:hypothetical protein